MLGFTETVLRDANQSLAATRMRLADFERILTEMDSAGYYSVECWGGATFDSCIRYLNEDPWERLRFIRQKMPHTKLQMLLRGQNLLGYSHYPTAIVRDFVKAAIRNGIDIIRIFDALNDIDNIRDAVKATLDFGGHPSCAICYTTSPVHTVDGFVKLAAEMEQIGAKSICIKDMSGCLMPDIAYELVTALKKAVSVPIILHTHCTSGVAQMTCLKAIEAGVDVIDTAISSFSGGTSQPATETMFYAFKQYGIDCGLDENIINKVNDFFKPVKQKYIDKGTLNPKSMGTDAQALVYKVPGGMLSNMIANLTDMKAMDKFDAALAEIPAVRADMGYPPLVTPLSQMVGNQAVTNVLVGERYKNISKEIKSYLKGEYGNAPAPVDADLQKKVLAEAGMDAPIDCRIEDSKRTGADFVAAKEALGDLAKTEEDVMSYICFPAQATKFLEGRKAKEENMATYTIVEA